MKKIFVIDWILLFAFVLSAYSGIELHIAGHGSEHRIWHNWAVFHVLTSSLFLIVTIFHIVTHWAWYKGIIQKGIGKKNKVTVTLSAAFLLTSITGIILLGIDGANTMIGLWHYRIGVIMALISAGHILRRKNLLYKSLRKRKDCAY